VFDHVTIRVSDRAESERFYATLLGPLGIERTHSDDALTEWDDVSLAQADAEHPVTRGLHIAFAAPSPAIAAEAWRVATAAGYRDDGAPGPRPEYGDDYYGAFLLDPDGNSAEAVHHETLRAGGHVDHLWIRVADVAASKAFYETIAPHAGLRLGGDTPQRAQFRGASGSFSVVAGQPTEHLHMAFPASGDATVDAFHAAATGAGYRDNGSPAERPAYHTGYYGAYVLDPDGNNIEVVSHNR
jgi:catechol 2,3-dioxygenase-like lactoylglutathione lyase family enzyme